MKPEGIRRFFSDLTISRIVRWWAAGAVYFFIGWGTGLGNQANMIDFVFWLGVSMGVFTMLVVDPVIRMALNLGPSRRPKNYAISQRVSDYLVAIIKNIFIIFCVALIYIGLNTAINSVFGLSAENISLPTEPIGFGICYVLIFVILENIVERIQQAVLNSKEKVKGS